jgi:hypothetical protein
MPDNLSIKIVADATQVNTQIDLLKAQLRDLGRQIKLASSQALVSGDKTVLQRLEADAEKTRVSIARLNEELKKLHRTAGDASAWRQAREGLESFEKILTTITSLGKATLVGGIFAEAAEGAKKFGEATYEAAHRVGELESQATALGITTEKLQAYQLAGARKGLEDTGAVIDRFKLKISQAALEYAKLTGEVPGRPSVIRGPGALLTSPTSLVRGGQQDITQAGTVLFSGMKTQLQGKDLFDLLGIDKRTFFVKPFEDQAAAIAKGFEPFRGTPLAPAIARDIGKNWPEILEFFKDLKKETADAEQFNKEHGTNISKETVEQGKALLKQFADAGVVVSSATTNALIKNSSTVSKWLDNTVNASTTAEAAIEEGWKALIPTWGRVTGELTKMWQGMLDGWEEDSAKTVGAINAIMRKIRPPAAATQLPEGGASAPLPERAAGGYIRGPGTGTSDSILARISNGEFITRAAAVRHYGTGLFEALNQQRFEFGGLVDAIHSRPGPNFADGGLVGDFDPSRYDFDPDKPGYSISKRYQAERYQATLARDQPRTPIHLHIGGGEYPVLASADIAQKLVDASRREQMASAGTKPSWYAG